MADMSTRRNAYEPLHSSSWYATTQTARPAGIAGTCEGEVSGTAFPVVLDADGLVWVHNNDEGREFWTPARGWTATDFTPYPPADDADPEWVCGHRDNPTPCTTERDCDALKWEQGDNSW